MLVFREAGPSWHPGGKALPPRLPLFSVRDAASGPRAHRRRSGQRSGEQTGWEPSRRARARATAGARTAKATQASCRWTDPHSTGSTALLLHGVGV